MEEQEYKEIVDFVKDGKYPQLHEKCKDKKRNFRRKCKSFILKNNELYYAKIKSAAHLKVILKGNTEGIINSVHTADIGGHLGVSKT